MYHPLSMARAKGPEPVKTYRKARRNIRVYEGIAPANAFFMEVGRGCSDKKTPKHGWDFYRKIHRDMLESSAEKDSA